MPDATAPDAGVPAGLLAAREGTGVAFPAAVAAHARARGAAALEDARAWGVSPDPLARLVSLELLSALAATGAGAVADAGDAVAGGGDAVLDLLAALAPRLAAEEDPELRWAVAKALSWGPPGAVDLLVGLARDGDPDVRWQAVSSLPLAAGSPADPAALAALAAASTDVEDDVADQAVFALAVQLDDDSPAVRDALAAHLRDAREDTGAQAALGLALRGDGRGVAAALARLRAAAAGGAEEVAELEEGWVEAAGTPAGRAEAGVREVLATLVGRAAQAEAPASLRGALEAALTGPGA